jgi:hypothetical protein
MNFPISKGKATRQAHVDLPEGSFEEKAFLAAFRISITRTHRRAGVGSRASFVRTHLTSTRLSPQI